MNRRGFTLIEILVVVAIVAALAAITLSVFSSVREGGRMTKCVSNLHQWSTALHLYIQDWDGLEPQIGRPVRSLYDLGLPPDRMEAAYLREYRLDRPHVHYCPSARPTDGRPKLPYGVQGYFAEPDPPQALLDMFASRGGGSPILFCLYHNSVPWPEQNPTYATMRAVVLRYNQQVQTISFKAFGYGSTTRL